MGYKQQHHMPTGSDHEAHPWSTRVTSRRWTSELSLLRLIEPGAPRPTMIPITSTGACEVEYMDREVWGGACIDMWACACMESGIKRCENDV